MGISGTTIGSFTLRDVLYEGDETSVYRALRDVEPHSVVIKLLHGQSSRDALTRLRHEYNILRRLDVEGVVRALGFEVLDGHPAMLMEDCGGESLADSIAAGGVPVDRLLAIGAGLATTLAALHDQHVIHRDISPKNVLWCPDSAAVKLIDFGIASVIPEQRQAQSSPNALEGTLAYLSPEQTGRMNRQVDYRSDFYSLGATLYHLATGRPPFETTDAAELVHCHIARVPPAPDTFRPELPRALVKIIMRLLAKNAEDRYQSGQGIHFDLTRCRGELEQGRAPDFPLGAEDVSDRFRVPQKLYGREKEIDALLQAFRGATLGQKTLIMVAGHTGVGKTSLVHEIYKHITGRGGHFVTGKFDQYKRDIPYGALADAFRELVRDVLAEGPLRLARRKVALLAALGPNGRIMTDLVPELELIIGPQPAVPDLSPAEARNRLNVVFQAFIDVFAREQHPLVLFLDDLQWVDSASLSLLQMVMTGPGKPCLLAIGAYRDNEVGSAHPLAVTLADMRKTGFEIGQVEIRDLTVDDVGRLVADMLETDVEGVRPLAALMRLKTGGNPFFLIELLKNLHRKGLIRFDRQGRRWAWDLGGVERLGLSDNVVDLMTAKIGRLDAGTQQALQLAACIGNRFDLPVLSMTCGKTPGDVMACLRPAVTEGLLFFLDEAHRFIADQQSGEGTGLLDAVLLQTVQYRFAHDKIQQAAYSLIPDEIRTTVHRQIGRHLLTSTPENQQGRFVFDIVNQLNEARDLLRTDEERLELAALNLTAGRRAKDTVAFRSGYLYLQVGIGLLGERAWNDSYALALDLHSEATEAAYLVTDFDEMERLAGVVSARAHTIFDQLKVYEVQLQANIGKKQQRLAVQQALPILARLGVSLPENPGKARVMAELLRVKAALAGKRFESLVNQPELTDERVRAIMRIGASILSAAYMASPNLFPLLVLRILRLTVKHGTTPLSAFAYVVYGLLLCGALGQVEKGYAYGQLAMRLQERFDEKKLESRVSFAYAGTVRHYKEPVRDVVAMLRDGIRVGLEVGDFEYVASNASMVGYFLYFAGEELGSVEAALAEFGALGRQLGQPTYGDYADLYRQVCLNLMGRSRSPCRLVGEAYDEDAMRPVHEKGRDEHALANLYLHKCFLNFLFEDYREAVSAADIARSHLEGVMSMLPGETFPFYDALARLALLPTLTARARRVEERHHRARIRADRRRLKRLARHGPHTHRHRLLLVDAERARLRGRAQKAWALYDEAIEAAGAAGFVHEEALACELAARSFLALGRRKVARAYLQDARYAYLRWGAAAKVAQLDETYPDLLLKGRTGSPGSNQTRASSANSTSEGEGGSARIDLAAVLKAARTVSGEIHLPSLLGTMMTILVENAGARRGVLVLESQEDLSVEAEKVADREDPDVLRHVPLRDYDGVPHAVVNYVLQSRESVVLDDAAREGVYARDPYFVGRPAASILCLPLIHQTKLVGVLYLENDLARAAFTPERVEVLEMLAAQIVVSLENARLYDGLERTNRELDERVSDRTRQLKDAHASLSREMRKSDALLLNILPARVAADLRERGQTEPESFENVTVLFSDFVGFTKLSAELEPKVLIGELNELFTGFDNIAEANGCERVKTIGDAYLCVCGMPEEDPQHVDRILRTAVAIVDFVRQREAALAGRQREAALAGRQREGALAGRWQVRIGVHSGRVVGGIVGVRKYIYDVFGDTINTASRMESHSEPMRINVSDTTRALAGDRFAFSPRPPVEVKGKGVMRMFFLESAG